MVTNLEEMEIAENCVKNVSLKNHDQLCEATLLRPHPSCPQTNSLCELACVVKLQNFFKVVSNIHIVNSLK